MNKKAKLPPKLSLALANYFIRSLLGRSREIGSKYVGATKVETHYSTPVKWDKDECLKKVEAALPKGWGYCAAAGTFWFFKGDKTIKVNDESWPLGEVSKNKAAKRGKSQREHF
jgi:hypothetical protein